MRKPLGYVTVYSDAPIIERDTTICGHCNQIIIVKPGSATTKYLIPQIAGPDKEVDGAACRCCMSSICLACEKDGRCTPLMRRIEEMEAKGRMLKAVGL